MGPRRTINHGLPPGLHIKGERQRHVTRTAPRKWTLPGSLEPLDQTLCSPRNFGVRRPITVVERPEQGRQGAACRRVTVAASRCLNYSCAVTGRVVLLPAEVSRLDIRWRAALVCPRAAATTDVMRDGGLPQRQEAPSRLTPAMLAQAQD